MLSSYFDAASYNSDKVVIDLEINQSINKISIAPISSADRAERRMLDANAWLFKIYIFNGQNWLFYHYIYRYASTLQPSNYLFWIFTHLKLCLTDVIQNFKWLKKYTYIFKKMNVKDVEMMLIDVMFYIIFIMF